MRQRSEGFRFVGWPLGAVIAGGLVLMLLLPRSARDASMFHGQPLLNWAIVVGTLACSWQGFHDATFLNKLIWSSHHVLRQRQYYRALTSGLVHADWPHLVFNLFSLYAFGRRLELWFGPLTFAAIYLAGIIGGSLVSLALHRREPYRALGASGGVGGVIFASVFLLPGGEIQVFLLPFAIPSWLYAIVFVLVSFVGFRHRLGNIGHDAHLGGALVGLLTATLLEPALVRANPLWYSAVVVSTAGLLIYLYWDARRIGPGLSLSSQVRRGWWASLRPIRRQSWTASEDEIMDRLLDKISRSGMDSLTETERQRLSRLAARKRLAGR